MTTDTLETLTVAGTRHEYRCCNTAAAAPGRPWLIFLHEGLGCVALWRDVPQRLAEMLGLPALVYSRAGYGRSDPVSWPRPVNYLHREAEQVLPAVLDAVGIDRAILFGHSDGATIALLHGAVLDPCAVIALAPHIFVEDEALAGIAEAGARYRTGDLKTRLGKYHANPDSAFYGWHDTWLSDAFRPWCITPELAAARCPALILQGDRDEYASTAQIWHTAEAWGGLAEAALLRDCGHNPHLERFSDVASLTAGFLKRHGAI